MRPVRIRLEGFSAYRAPVEVDFAGVDFFSLSGATGAGKSSLVDAMVFALYGRVPRLGGNAVAPAISAGGDRARVAFDFEVAGTGYTAVRMAQRTAGGGATVREARLQQGDQVLASGADEVTRAVEELLRLRFDDFTRTVVLPQGEFARFLTATKAERQGLLRDLLGLDVYTRVRDLAKTRAAVASDRAEVARGALEALDLGDEEAIAEARRRAALLEEVSEKVAAGEKELPALDRRVEESRAALGEIDRALEDLGAIQPPDRLGELDTLNAEARSRLVDAEKAEEEARELEAATAKVLEGIAPTEQIDAWRRDQGRLAALEARLGDDGLAEARAHLGETEAALRRAEADAERAEQDLGKARELHAAHTLAGSLVVGSPCPVCLQPVSELPRHDIPDGLAMAEADREASREALEAARSSLSEAGSGLAAVEAARAELEAQCSDLRLSLASVPSVADLEALAERRRALEGELKERANVVGALVEARKKTQTALDELAESSRRVGRDLTTALMRVAYLHPPTSESDDAVVAWKELLDWRDSTLDRLRAERGPAEETAVAAIATSDEARRLLRRLLEENELPAEEPYSFQVALACQNARSVVEAHERAAEQAEALRRAVAAAEAEGAVAGALAGHLRADGFERWMMAGALGELVAGANHLLAQLSDGGYSLASDDSGAFSIVDHRNADEVRSVSTLSGGETFLVSLALALSLAETLAAKGGSGLDAVILDEGFGTLDEEALDTVASVLEELTGRLMVGVITHVKELAARAPVRYEVRREPSGARVERLA